MSVLTELTWVSMTQTVNEIKSPNQFIKNRLFSNHQALRTEHAQFDILNRARVMAPLVRKNGAALTVDGHTTTRRLVETPNIRIKMPFTPSDLLFTRRAGTSIYPTDQEQTTAIREHIARDMAGMNDMVVNTEEWMCASALRGTLSYSVTDEEVLQVTYLKPAGNTVTLTGSNLWDDTDLNNPSPDEDFHTAKKLIHDETGLQLTDAIMGETAAQQFRAIIKAQSTLDKLYVDAGRVTLNEQFSTDGVLFLGTFCGVRCWEYSRTALLDGTATPMIRANYVEFVSASPMAENVLYYGAIPDMDAMGDTGRPFVGERFSKSWLEKDPSVMMALLHTRPLPVTRRPGANVSMKVTA